MSRLDLFTELDDYHLLLSVLWNLKMADCVLSITKHDAKEVGSEVIDQRMYTRLVLFECLAEFLIVLLTDHLLYLLDKQ